MTNSVNFSIGNNIFISSSFLKNSSPGDKIYSGHFFFQQLKKKMCHFLFPSWFQIRNSVQFSHSVLCNSATPWIAACQASLSITNSWSSLRLTSIEPVMLSSHLILCCPLFPLPPIPPSIRVFSNESTLCMRWLKYWSFSFSIIPSKEHPIIVISPSLILACYVVAQIISFEFWPNSQLLFWDLLSIGFLYINK